MNRGSRQIPDLSMEQVKELQQLLARGGFEVGEIDGKIGAATRSSVKTAQMKFGLPADSYPTVELIERLRAQR
jgi:peptidoglycan hydrolase-like protein with peptidoglycan-binding domain